MHAHGQIEMKKEYICTIMELEGIYHSSIPSFFGEIMHAPAMERLRNVGMNCGCEYTRTLRSRHIGAYSRFEHSVGAGLIVWHFTSDVRQSVSALLHDVATPVFAHVVDFLHGDHMRQESTESTTLSAIASSPELVAALSALGLKPEDVSDYHLFPIADNDTPRLSSDRLEYTMGNLVNYGFGTLADARRLYSDLMVGTNEEGAPEIMFRTKAAASEFARLALDCSKVYVSDEDRYTMQMLAELLRDQIARGVLCEADLWRTEPEVIARLQSDPEAAAAWAEYCAYGKVVADAPGPKARKINAKKRHINPFVEGVGRVTDFDADFRASLQAFLGRSFDYWISSDND